MFYCRIKASPLETGYSIANILNVLLFPAPFGPSSPKIDPCFTPKVLPQTANNPFGYVFVILLALIGQITFY